MSSAARTARSASSSRTAGTPKTAITASPMNFSITASWRSSTALTERKYCAITWRSVSGSSPSPSLVESHRSQKTIVTTLRRPSGDLAPASANPHSGQNRASSGVAAPQLGHELTARVYGGGNSRDPRQPASQTPKRSSLPGQVRRPGGSRHNGPTIVVAGEEANRVSSPPVARRGAGIPVVTPAPQRKVTSREISDVRGVR